MIVAITKCSQFTGQIHTRAIDAPDDQWERYFRGGGLIQFIFPDMSEEDREFLITGTTPEEWAEMVGEPWE